MTSTQLVVLLVVLAVVGAAGWFVMRHQRLRKRFGPEYDQVRADQDNVVSAERELRDRERRHRQLELRELDTQTQQRYARAWRAVQEEFVTDPAGAVIAGDELVTRLVRERGYPTEDFEDELSYLSVDHARVLGHYRDAHDVYLRGQRGEANTEDLRQALVHYRALFADLLGVEPTPAPSDPSTNARASGSDAAANESPVDPRTQPREPLDESPDDPRSQPREPLDESREPGRRTRDEWKAADQEEETDARNR